MATSSVQANNAAVRFRGKGEREMSMESKAQNAAMHAAAEGRSTLGIPKKIGQEFVRASKGQKVKRLPMHVKKQARHMARRGMISERALKKMEGTA